MVWFCPTWYSQPDNVICMWHHCIMDNVWVSVPSGNPLQGLLQTESKDLTTCTYSFFLYQFRLVAKTGPWVQRSCYACTRHCSWCRSGVFVTISPISYISTWLRVLGALLEQLGGGGARNWWPSQAKRSYLLQGIFGLKLSKSIMVFIDFDWQKLLPTFYLVGNTLR